MGKALRALTPFLSKFTKRTPSLNYHRPKNTNMKWYFALSQQTAAKYSDHVKIAVLSAKQHTTLSANFIYDGADDELCGWMKRHGVNVIFAEASHKSKFQDAALRGYNVDVACGAFLRTEIPMIDRSDEVILYTDCDVLFLQDPQYDTSDIRYFAAAPESDIADYSVNGMNTGVLFMNLKNLRAVQASFQEFIGKRFEKFGAFDQDAYRIYFNGLWEHLHPSYNWKPYWGKNSDAKIIHFHGPKYEDIKGLIGGERKWWRYEALFHGNRSEYSYLLDMVEKMLLDQ